MNPILRALTGPADQPELILARTYRAPLADVRDAVTDPERLACWFARVDGAPSAVGDAWTATFDGHDEPVRGRVLACEPDGFTVSWAWGSEPESVVRLRLTALGEECTELTIRHALVEPGDAADYGGGWEEMLTSLAVATGEDADLSAVEARGVRAWGRLAGHPLTLERDLPAPPERVWAALASAEGLATWWWTHWPDVTRAADVRPGGCYRIEAPGAGIAVEGEYLVVEAPRRLAFTWCWRDADGVTSDEAVDLRLTPGPDGGTRLTLRHTGPWADGEAAASYAQGWDFVLGVLATAVARPSET